MAIYDHQCSLEFAALKKRLDKYFLEVTVECPYGMKHAATFYQGMFGQLSDRLMELFFAAGYRRNGNALYAMHCAGCKACVPIRLHPREFVPNRSQKRILHKNRDLDISVAPIRPSVEALGLCQRFLQTRFPSEGNTADSYYSGFFLNRMTTTFEVRYRLEGRLVGDGIIDLGDNWLNMVYFFFDPDFAKRGLGIFNILAMIKFCLKKNIDYIYLGYAIDALSSMSYKKGFRPYYCFRDGVWLPGE